MGTKKRSVARRSPGSRPRSAATVAVVPAPVTPWVIGVGASAGGLRALEELLAAVPPRSGLAFLIVQHLDPTHRSDLPELLQRQTSLPVQLARQGTVVAPDTVHVLPPNREMTVENGRLRLRPRPAAAGLPINTLFTSLAAAYGARSVGVVLSGMGIDGTDGLKAIHAQGGLGCAQEPAGAPFPSMPASAIAAGAVSIVASPVDIARRLLQDRGGRALGSAGPPPPGFEDILAFLNEQAGHAFEGYKGNTMLRRIERRVAAHGLAGLPAYAQFLREHPDETALLTRELLIGVTRFFRDPAVWAHLEETVLPALLARHPVNQPFRIWVPGCSTGEEAYSLAILLVETMERRNPPATGRLQIFATDLNDQAIEQARRGVFGESLVEDLSSARLARHFTAIEGGYQVTKALRQAIVFAVHDINHDPPFTRVDLISCRNLLIYLTPDSQGRLITLFHDCLVETGVLVLGMAETPVPGARWFQPQDAALRIFQRTSHTARPGAATRRALPRAGAGTRPVGWAPPVARPPLSDAEAALLERYAPPAVVINDHGDILQFIGNLGRFLTPASGKASLNIHAMARPAIRYELAAVLEAVGRRKSPAPVQSPGVSVGGTQVRISAARVRDPVASRQPVLVTFEKVADPGRDGTRTGAVARGKAATRRLSPAATDRVHRAEREARTLRLQMQQFQEQLQSSNEELQATNEELQTTNEELTTAQEEMQSTNEELQSVNAELQSELARLATVNADLQNLLNGANVAIVFLDAAFRVRRYTREALALFKFGTGDVGRALVDIKSNLLDGEPGVDISDWLCRGSGEERDLRTKDGRWYACRVLPYRTVENVVDGSVLTFTDITKAKQLEAALRAVPAAAHRELP